MRAGLQLSLALPLALCAASPALAQRLELRVAQTPYYVGVPVDLRLVASGFEEAPEPELRFDEPSGASLDVRSVSPKVSSFMQIINGKVTQSRQVEFVYSLRFIARVPGTYALGPFRVVQGGVERSTRTLEVTVSEIPLAESQRIRLVLPEGRVYVGQRVPVVLEWWTDAAVADELLNQRAVVPLFDQAERFRFLEEAPDSSLKFAVVVDTQGGLKEFPARAEHRRDGARIFIVRTVTRTMVPLEAGTLVVEPATLIVDEAVAWRRDFFGIRTPTRIRTLRAVGRQQTLEVAALPEEGRPPSFAGAVGSGYSLEVRADRTVVQVGDPIRLELLLRGSEGLEEAALPPLERAGLDPRAFRVPDRASAGILREGAKRFEVAVRVVDEAVSAVPPIEYAWFDPAVASYRTTRSEPVALSVEAADLVSASDVFRAGSGAQEPGAEVDEDQADAAKADRPDASPGEVPTGVVLTGADLSIEEDVERLLGGRRAVLAGVAQAGMYVLGVAALAAGVALRRRDAVDPELRRRRRAVGALAQRVEAAATAGELASALRELRLVAGDEERRSIDETVGALDDLAFAPGHGDRAPSAELRTRAREIIAAVKRGLQ